jgi:hypothetical protein
MQANRGVGHLSPRELKIHHLAMGLTKEWLGLHFLHPCQWMDHSIKSWWSMMLDASIPDQKALASLTSLTFWEIWNERNASLP